MRKDKYLSKEPNPNVYSDEKLLAELVTTGVATKTVDKEGNEHYDFTKKQVKNLTKEDIQKRIFDLKNNLVPETLRIFHGVIRYRLLFGTKEIRQFFEHRVAEDIIKLVFLDATVLDDSFIKEIIHSWWKQRKTEYLKHLIRALEKPPKDLAWVFPHVIAHAVYNTYQQDIGYSPGKAIKEMTTLFNLSTTAIKRAIFVPTDRFVSPYSRKGTFNKITDTEIHALVSELMSAQPKMNVSVACSKIAEKRGIPKPTVRRDYDNVERLGNEGKIAIQRERKLKQ